MKEQTTRLLLILVAVLLLANLMRPPWTSTPAHAQGSGEPIPVLRAQAIELVDKQGKVVAQLTSARTAAVTSACAVATAWSE